MSADFDSTAGVAGRYASALFELARDASALENVEQDLKTFSSAIDQSEELKNLLRSPVYDREEQRAAIEALAARAGLGELASNFLKLAAQNRRLFAVEKMIHAFNSLLSAHRGEVAAEAISAAPLNDDQTRALRHEIEAMVGKAVNLETRVDPDLLGGLIVKIGSKMIDTSLKTKLNRLKTVMKEA
ncbi:MAG: F0F1 ATP synthase subunit delta [Pseudomonadota bacterium]